MLEASIGTFRVLKERSAIAEVLIALGRLATSQGDNETAQASYQESWDLLRTIGAKELSINCLEGYGEVLVAQGAPGKAVQLWATAATSRAAIMSPMPPIYRTSYTQASNQPGLRVAKPHSNKSICRRDRFISQHLALSSSTFARRPWSGTGNAMHQSPSPV